MCCADIPQDVGIHANISFCTENGLAFSSAHTHVDSSPAQNDNDDNNDDNGGDVDDVDDDDDDDADDADADDDNHNDNGTNNNDNGNADDDGYDMYGSIDNKLSMVQVRHWH